MSDPASAPPSVDHDSEPGAPRLARPPSARFVDASRGPSAGAGDAATRDGRAAIPRGTFAAACLVAVMGAALLTVILGVLTATAGTFAVSGLAGAVIGLLIASATVPGMATAGAMAPAPLTRAAATRVAMRMGGAMIVLAGIGVWLLARAEGGVLDPISYLWTTFGFGIPAQAVVAVVAAAWGAANGPIRWRR